MSRVSAFLKDQSGATRSNKHDRGWAFDNGEAAIGASYEQACLAFLERGLCDNCNRICFDCCRDFYFRYRGRQFSWRPIERKFLWTDLCRTLVEVLLPTKADAGCYRLGETG